MHTSCPWPRAHAAPECGAHAMGLLAFNELSPESNPPNLKTVWAKGNGAARRTPSAPYAETFLLRPCPAR